MLYVNDHLVTEEKEVEIVAQQLKDYLFTEKLIIVKQDQQPMSQDELASLLLNNNPELRLVAMHTSVLLSEFNDELETYIRKVEVYIEDMRETENFSDVLSGFVQVTEALLEFSSVEEFLQKSLLDQQQMNDISTKALARAEEGNYEYVLDVLEYEVLTILQHFLDETNEVM
ncbi:hypothetical protein MKX53_04360 [Psychrobacillus sp. FSL K6-4615]|uniref:hypothetical protein n=1 Tax=Psychrobacillus sp. FSL K6-4615 TaxID=2921551 RepID=UPI0030F7E990